jgi:uncharacterized protein (TIGR02118 family)
MIKVSVFYPNEEGKRFDTGYYFEKHVPLVQEKLGAAVKGLAVEQGLGGVEPGSKPAYLMMFHLTFDSLEAFQGAMGPHFPAISADIPNYTNIMPLIQISEVKI